MSVLLSSKAQKDCDKQKSRNRRFHGRLVECRNAANSAGVNKDDRDLEKKGYYLESPFKDKPVWAFCPFGRNKQERVLFILDDEGRDQFVLRIFTSHDQYERYLDGNTRKKSPPRSR